MSIHKLILSSVSFISHISFHIYNLNFWSDVYSLWGEIILYGLIVYILLAEELTVIMFSRMVVEQTALEIRDSVSLWSKSRITYF